MFDKFPNGEWRFPPRGDHGGIQQELYDNVRSLQKHFPNMGSRWISPPGSASLMKQTLCRSLLAILTIFFSMFDSGFLLLLIPSVPNYVPMPSPWFYLDICQATCSIARGVHSSPLLFKWGGPHDVLMWSAVSLWELTHEINQATSCYILDGYRLLGHMIVSSFHACMAITESKDADGVHSLILLVQRWQNQLSCVPW